MDVGGSDEEGFAAGGFGMPEKKPRALPSDLPTSLDDRRHVPVELVQETEYYDGWQGGWLPRGPNPTPTHTHAHNIHAHV